MSNGGFSFQSSETKLRTTKNPSRLSGDGFWLEDLVAAFSLAMTTSTPLRQERGHHQQRVREVVIRAVWRAFGGAVKPPPYQLWPQRNGSPGWRLGGFSAPANWVLSDAMQWQGFPPLP